MGVRTFSKSLVAPRWQGRGCGTRLIATAEAWAQDSGFTEMTLTTFRDVGWNAPFFRNLGYESIEIGSDRPRTRWSDCGRTAIGLSWHVAHRDAQVVRSLKNKQTGGTDE